LLLVLFLIGVGFLLMTGALRWSGANSTLADRHNDYYRSLAAAEAATEKVISMLAPDFQSGGMGAVDANLGAYGGSYPTAGESAEWGEYDFTNPLGGSHGTYVAKHSDWAYTGLAWKYSGFGAYAASYRIISNARNIGSGNDIVGAVQQDIQVASLPLFEFGIFYGVDMELNPRDGDFQVTGRVHSNRSIYCEPDQRNLTFCDHVTAAQNIVHDNHPDDPESRTFGSVTYLGERDSGVTSLNLPIGAANTPEALRSITEIPPSGEAPGSLLGQQRFYNKADLIILVTNATPVAYSGVNNGFFDVTSYVTNFVTVSTNTFENKRETRSVLFTELDIAKLNASFASLRAALGRYPTVLYIADLRSPGLNEQSGVRLINGQSLPAAAVGLTIATLNPLYVKGHYNAYPAHLGTTNTSQAKPASLIADAVTVLSGNWNDANSGLGLSARLASDTTINAAIIAGIVPSGGGAYSGGVENFIRLLEDWSGHALTFNGSVVVLYESQIARGPWGGIDVYSPPVRRFSFDWNFKDPNRLPPGRPELRAVIRSQWAAIRPNEVP